MGKVYCKNCKYLETSDFIFAPYLCRHNPKIESDPINGGKKFYSTCKSKNQNCDCPHYEPTGWVKFLTWLGYKNS